MSSKQEDLFVHAFKKFKPTDKFYAIKILEELLIKDELCIEDVYYVFSNKKKTKIRKILNELEKTQLIQEVDNNYEKNKKIYKITNSGEQLVISSYTSHPLF